MTATEEEARLLLMRLDVPDRSSDSELLDDLEAFLRSLVGLPVASDPSTQNTGTDAGEVQTGARS